MELTHKLTYNNTTTVISEPIGFDDLKMTLKRHDLHGIGAEVSLGNLEFYGTAFNIIKTAYEADIDSEVVYAVFADQTEIYSGKIDLSTYCRKIGKYESISVKIGEQGVKTDFNNRIDTDINLNIPKTLGGGSVSPLTWQKIAIPKKHLPFTNKTIQDKDSNFYRIGGGGLNVRKWNKNENIFVGFPIGDWQINEFGTTSNMTDSITTTDVDTIPYFYSPDQQHSTIYGENTKADIKISLHISIAANLIGTSTQTASFRFLLVCQANENQSMSLPTTITFPTNNTQVVFDLDLEIDTEKSASTQIKYFLIVTYLDDTQIEGHFSFKIKEDTSLSMVMYDNIRDKKASITDMALVHDALNTIVHAISDNQLSVKSTWYQTPESMYNDGEMGGGALKAITNGYKIRGLFSTSKTERNFPLSFKSLIQNLNIQDCIGYGFTNEDGDTYLRVERWTYFYQNHIMVELTDVADIQIDIIPEKIITDFTIGYKKYATSDQYNSIDSIHGARTFTRDISSVNNSINQECDFIADNYAIEETRRARERISDTEETTYDENIFIFELTKYQGKYFIENTANDLQYAGNNSELINAKLSPRHMASRWKDYLFTANSDKPFNFNAGKLNYKASFSVWQQYHTGTDSLQPFDGIQQPMAENANIDYEPSICSAQIATFSCHITRQQYQLIKDNPYGLVVVNGELEGWISELTISIISGMADFKLILKK